MQNRALNPASPERYRGLDGLRGLAAFAVLIHHTAIKGTDIGGLAVTLFFLLSGFLITGILHRSRAKIEAGELSRRAALKEFWVQRALRIFPAYYLWFVVFLFLDVHFFSSQVIGDWPWYVVYLQNIFVGYFSFAWNNFTHTWSLAVEQQYYVFFAPLVLLLPRRWHVQFLWGAIALCGLAMLSLRALGYETLTQYVSPSSGFVYMAAGGLIAILRPKQIKFVPWPIGLSGALLAVVLLALYPVAERNHLATIPYWILNFSTCLTFSTLMIWVLTHESSWVVNMLESRPLKFLGLISYGLYIVHLPVGALVSKFADVPGVAQTTGLPKDTVELFLVGPLSIGLAAASYFGFEKYFLKLKSRFRAKASNHANTKIQWRPESKPSQLTT